MEGQIGDLEVEKHVQYILSVEKVRFVLLAINYSFLFWSCHI